MIQRDLGKDGAVWTHMDFFAEESGRYLREESGLDPLIVEAILDKETRPRFVETEDGGCMVILRAINCDVSSLDEMVSVRMWIDCQRVITVVKARLRSAEEIIERLDKGNGPTCTAEFVIALIKGILAHIEPVLGALDEETEGWEEEIPARNHDLLFGELSEMKRRALVLRRYLAPERDVFFQLGRAKNLFSKQQMRQIQEQHDRSLRYVEDLDVIKDRIAAIEEELKGRMSTHINRAMYIFSLVAVIFLPLTFVTGLFGINVGGIPGADTPYGFVIFSTITVFIAAGLVAFFKKIRWF